MLGVVWPGGDDVRVLERPRPVARDGWAVLDVAYAGVCGTDLHICAGHHPRARPGLVLGHELVGRLATDAPGLPAGAPVVVDPLLPCGDCAQCARGAGHRCVRLRLVGIDVDGGMAEQVAVPYESLVAVPPEADLERVAFAEPLAVAVHAVERAALEPGDVVGVAGAGPVGLAVALTARLDGARVLVREPAPERREVARQLGFELSEDGDGSEVDRAFDCAAHPAVAASITGWVAGGGRVVVVGSYTEPVAVDLLAVAFRELEIVGTRVYRHADVERAVALIAGGDVDPSALTHVVALEGAVAGIRDLFGGVGIKLLVAGRA
jgi:(R,R)-butanediol dehydrogenase/meso-butanediol dehydrogenase/diacetyl reductase